MIVCNLCGHEEPDKELMLDHLTDEHDILTMVFRAVTHSEV